MREYCTDSVERMSDEADERWKSIPSYLDTSNVRKQPQLAIGVQDPGGYTASGTDVGKDQHASAVESGNATRW